MRKNFIRRGFMAVPFLLGLFFFAGLTNAYAETLYAVTTTNQLIRFDSARPNSVASIGTITGLQAAENILGIDFRPVNGQLYALGSASRLYTINLMTGGATQVGNAGNFTLSGTDFGFDFNPTVDRIRVVSNTGQNLRLNPNDGTLSATDPNLNPNSPQVTAAAYTNNFAGAATTVLFDIDSGSDTLFQQNPANAGTLVAVGPLGVDTTGVNGFDISSANGRAYAALTVGGTSRLYTINLQSGATTLVGTIGNGAALRGLAVAFGSTATGTDATALDFDGDRRADLVNYRLSNNTFYIGRSSNNYNSFYSVQFGFVTDIIQPGDYDGDGRADIAVYRPSNATWYILQSSNNNVRIVRFGTSDDQPVAYDYDGDGRTDIAVARRVGGQLLWIIMNSSTGNVTFEQFGLSTDIVAPGDYDGDGRVDLAVYRGASSDPSSLATFYVRRSSDNTVSIVQFGLASDFVVPGDYDGDGRTDYAVLRAGTQFTWYILLSASNTLRTVEFGARTHYSVQADYDGDGRTDIATFDPITATYYILRSSTGTILYAQFGQSGDYPVANYNTF